MLLQTSNSIQAFNSLEIKVPLELHLHWRIFQNLQRQHRCLQTNRTDINTALPK